MKCKICGIESGIHRYCGDPCRRIGEAVNVTSVDLSDLIKVAGGNYKLIGGGIVQGLSYFHLEGGAGPTMAKKGSGGHYKWYAFYATPGEIEKRDGASGEFFCENLGLPCGYGDTPEDAVYGLIKAQR